jgi:hypothetical protein
MQETVMKRITPLLLMLATCRPRRGRSSSIRDVQRGYLRPAGQLAREHEWQEWLRFQQAIKWLEVLPVNCELMSDQDGSYRCGG